MEKEDKTPTPEQYFKEYIDKKIPPDLQYIYQEKISLIHAGFLAFEDYYNKFLKNSK